MTVGSMASSSDWDQFGCSLQTWGSSSEAGESGMTSAQTACLFHVISPSMRLAWDSQGGLRISKSSKRG